MYEYEGGNLVKEKYPYGDVWLYEYDAIGNLVKKTYPYGGEYLYEYDDVGNKVKETNPYGIVSLKEFIKTEETFIVKENGEQVLLINLGEV